MARETYDIKSVAIIGAGASGMSNANSFEHHISVSPRLPWVGAAAAAALKAEGCFEVIRIFERRECAGGTWIYDPDPGDLPLHPGALPPQIDSPLPVPKGSFPQTLSRGSTCRTRYEKTPIYEGLTTNVPDIAMSFTDLSFPYGPFTPHWIPKQYIENYLSYHRLDSSIVSNTTVEDVTLIDRTSGRWKLTLRRPNALNNNETWWQEDFDGLIIANGHYSVPFIPSVANLSTFMSAFPSRIEHSKTYRTPRDYTNKKVLIIGNSASGHDVMTQLRKSNLCRSPIYVSRRSRSRWDGDGPPRDVVWKPVVKEYDADTGDIHFVDGTKLEGVDRVIYCTGYRASFPFWNADKNGGPLFDYQNDRLSDNYQHTFITHLPSVALVGLPRVLTFRSFEYQSIAIARLWSNRAAFPLPAASEQSIWLKDRAECTKRSHRRFHEIEWDTGETMEWFRYLFELAGLPTLEGFGRFPPVLGYDTRWAIDNIKKYPDHGGRKEASDLDEDGWVVVAGDQKDSLWFV